MAEHRNPRRPVDRRTAAQGVLGLLVLGAGAGAAVELAEPAEKKRLERLTRQTKKNLRDAAAVLLFHPQSVASVLTLVPYEQLVYGQEPIRLDNLEPAQRVRTTAVLHHAAGYGGSNVLQQAQQLRSDQMNGRTERNVFYGETAYEKLVSGGISTGVWIINGRPWQFRSGAVKGMNDGTANFCVMDAFADDRGPTKAPSVEQCVAALLAACMTGREMSQNLGLGMTTSFPDEGSPPHTEIVRNLTNHKEVAFNPGSGTECPGSFDLAMDTFREIVPDLMAREIDLKIFNSANPDLVRQWLDGPPELGQPVPELVRTLR